MNSHRRPCPFTNVWIHIYILSHSLLIIIALPFYLYSVEIRYPLSFLLFSHHQKFFMLSYWPCLRWKLVVPHPSPHSPGFSPLLMRTVVLDLKRKKKLIVQTNYIYCPVYRNTLLGQRRSAGPDNSVKRFQEKLRLAEAILIQLSGQISTYQSHPLIFLWDPGIRDTVKHVRFFFLLFFFLDSIMNFDLL